ncbi:hypothetical protein CHS0354_010498 [Potamilus streckersoni]|uniref:Uncharacterized protein n=1 Tax=Potamilus streckersoni TaxID=2493646 RepID=A0AAE0T5E7_9BIVA|nr:hypothetical protein CHS0354_010498 [Potamilus streckersoni]
MTVEVLDNVGFSEHFGVSTRVKKGQTTNSRAGISTSNTTSPHRIETSTARSTITRTSGIVVIMLKVIATGYSIFEGTELN